MYPTLMALLNIADIAQGASMLFSLVPVAVEHVLACV